jgi:hypothetical protein
MVARDRESSLPTYRPGRAIGVSQVTVPDSYQAYIERKHAAEDAERDPIPRCEPSTPEASSIPDWDFREPTPYAENPTIVRGPYCSDGLHWFEATLWLVPPPPDDPKLLPNRMGQPLVVLGAMAAAIPLIGWVLTALVWLSALVTEGVVWLANGSRRRQREAGRLAQLRDGNLPWGWQVRRCGPDPWPLLWVSVEWLQRLGLRQPKRDPSGWFLVEQIEPTRREAIAAAQRACELLSL